MVEAEEYTLDVEVELRRYNRRLHRTEHRRSEDNTANIRLRFTFTFT